VLVLDDLHWAEPTSLHLFTHLVRGLAGAPVVFAATYRDTGEATGDHLRTTVADLVRLGATRVELAGLDQIELGELVHARVTATAGHDVGPLAAQLRSETAGNPLFAEHLLKHWSESAKLDLVPAPRPGEFAGIAVLPPSDPGDLPATIRDLVWRRAGVLGGDARSMLGAAAVLGVEFEERIVATMTGLSPEAVDDLLDRAVSAGLVTAPLPAASTSRFTHALFARALETELGVRTATRLHAAAFDALLETLPAASTGVAPDRSRRTAARLVHHAECAGRIIEARRWAQVAGDDALADLAAEEAVGWFQRALDHADALGVADGERADLVVRLGDAQYRAGHPAGLDTVQQGAMLAERSGNDEALVRAALATDPGFIVRRGTFVPQQLALAEAALARVGEDDLATRARLHALIAQTLAPTDRTARRTAAATSALELARACGDPRVVARVAPNVLLALWAPGAAALRSSIAAEATEIAESLGDPSLAAGVYQAAYSTAVCIGDAAAEQRYRQKLRDIAEEIAEPRVRWMTGLLDCFVATMAGRFREAEALAAAAFDLGNRIGEPNAWTAFAGQTFVIGTFEGRHAELLPLLQHIIDTQDSIDLTMRLPHAIVCVEVGDTEAATALLAEAMAKGIATIPQDFMRITVLLGYAVLALELGDVEVAGALLPELVGLAGEVSFNGASSQGPVAAYVGKLLSLLGRHAEAECHLTEALSTTEAFGWEYHRATTLFALAHNRVRATGALDPTAAGWLDGAEELCARHGIASWARRARALRER